MTVISCKAFLYYDDVTTIKDEVIFHQSEIAPDGATTRQTQCVFHQTRMHFPFRCGNIWLGSAHNQARLDRAEGFWRGRSCSKFSHVGQTFYDIVPRQHHEKFADVPDVKPFNCGFGCTLENAFVSRGGQRKPKTGRSLLFFWMDMN